MRASRSAPALHYEAVHASLSAPRPYLLGPNYDKPLKCHAFAATIGNEKRRVSKTSTCKIGSYTSPHHGSVSSINRQSSASSGTFGSSPARPADFDGNPWSRIYLMRSPSASITPGRKQALRFDSEVITRPPSASISSPISTRALRPSSAGALEVHLRQLDREGSQGGLALSSRSLPNSPGTRRSAPFAARPRGTQPWEGTTRRPHSAGARPKVWLGVSMPFPK